MTLILLFYTCSHDPQIAGGKEFKGQSFVSKPSEIKYIDFEVGQVYRKVITLTNASYTFNSFKIQDLDDEIVDFFVVKFDKPGRVSAGECFYAIK